MYPAFLLAIKEPIKFCFKETIRIFIAIVNQLMILMTAFRSKLLLLALFCTAIAGKPATAQSTLSGNESQDNYQKAYVGLGLGLDYGGVGLRAEFLPSKYIGLFGGGGYNLQDISYNVGVSYKILPDNRVTPVITAMYGYNAVIKIPYWAKTYFGPSLGAGCEIGAKQSDNKLSLILFVPLRNDDFHNRYNELKEEGYQFKPGAIPVAFSIGYNFALKSKAVKR